MATPLTTNRLGAVPTAETIPMGGPIAPLYTTPVGLGVTVNVIDWIDAAAWGFTDLQAFVTAFGGTLTALWSIDDAHLYTIPGAALPPVVAGVPYDSGDIAPLAQWLRIQYTQAGGGASGVCLFKLLAGALAGGGGGGGGGIIIGPLGLGDPATGVGVTERADQASLPAPNPSAILAPATLPDIREPDGALRTRARVLTDEGAFYDDFPGAALARALTGTAIFTAGLTAVTGVGSLFTTEIRVGDYVYRNADTYTAAAQVQSIESNTALTLRAVYGGAGGAAAASSVVNFDETIVDGAAAGSAITVAGSEVVLTQAGLALNDAVSIARALGAGGLKAGMPARVAFALRLDQRRANQLTFVGLFNAPTLATATAGAYVQLTGTDANTVVRIASATALGVVVSEQLITLPNAAHTDNVIAFEMIVRPDRVEFYTYDSADTLTLMGVIPAHLLDPYAPLSFLAAVYNSGIVAGATILRIEQVSVLSVNALEAEVFCSDPARLRASAVDITPNGPSSATTTAVAVDVVVNIAATVAGEAYRFSVDGGAGFCIRVDGVDPVVTDECWADGQKCSFVSTVTSASGVRCIKKTAGTADGSCTVTRLV